MNATPLWRDRRFATLIVLVAIVAGAVVVMADAFATWRAETAALDALEHRAHLLEARAAAVAGSARAEPEGPGLDALRLLVEAESPGLAAAELQRLFSGRVESTGAVVRALDAPRIQPQGDIRDPEGGRLMRMQLDADIEVMEQSLPDLLLAIEASLPILVIDAFSLRTNRRVDTVAGDVWVSAADRPLTLRLSVSSFFVGRSEP